MVKLSPDEAAKLYDPTIIYRYDDDGDYIAAVEMWHQLHCLVRNFAGLELFILLLTIVQNFIRKAIWAEHPFVFYGRENTQIEEVNHVGE